jgi:serine phosphatase RsbU (regulator of sigma subunit)
MSENKAILSADAGRDKRFLTSESVTDLQIRSVMCAPLLGSGYKPLGLIQIDTRRGHFSTDDLDVLVNVANLAGQALAHARLHETQLRYDRRERDMKVAKQLQLHFLPQERPPVTGYRLFDYYQAAESVGGDYFGYIDLPDGRLALAMGDVAGKGVSAALLMARLCSDVRSCLLASSDPVAAVRSLNRNITKIVEYGRFVTFAVCVMDLDRHEAVIINAGHMPPLVRRAAGPPIESLGEDVSGPPLGVDPELHYRSCRVTLDPGDALLLYTDGVNEARNASGELYGIDRIQQVFGRTDTAEAAVEAMLADVRQFSLGTTQNDDICLVCLSRDPGASS